MSLRVRSFGPYNIFFGDGPVHILPYDPQCHELFIIYCFQIFLSYLVSQSFDWAFLMNFIPTNAQCVQRLIHTGLLLAHLLGSCYSIFCFIIVVCPFSLGHCVSVFLRLTDYDYLVGIVKLFICYLLLQFFSGIK
jgi:hypothetical protein